MAFSRSAMPASVIRTSTDRSSRIALFFHQPICTSSSARGQGAGIQEQPSPRCFMDTTRSSHITISVMYWV